jgi:hypothetical protein
MSAVSCIDTSEQPLLMAWEHGSAQVQPLGAMLGPVRLRVRDSHAIDFMHVAPWAAGPGTPGLPGLPGIMRRLRGEWPCIPFGRTDYPDGLPPGWIERIPDDKWDHGYASNHVWQCIESTPTRVRMAIDYPPDAAVARIERIVEADPRAPALNISLTVWARRASRLPAGLHPTFRLPSTPARVAVMLGAHKGIYSYPTSAGPDLSRLLPDTRSDSMARMAGTDGPLDWSRLPYDGQAEDLMQVRSVAAEGVAPPFALHYLDDDACVGLWWDTAQLPDLMLWVSNRGRAHFPWSSRHMALGAEPVNSLFDLGRVAVAPPGHPLAGRLGVTLTPAHPWQTHYRIAAWSHCGQTAA